MTLGGSALLAFAIAVCFTFDKAARPPFPTRVFRAQSPLSGASESGEKKEFNIGVIQVRLKHWTTTTPAPTSTELSVIEEFYSPFRRGVFTLMDSFRYRAELQTATKLPELPELSEAVDSHWRKERGYRTPLSAEEDGGWRGRQNSRHSVRSSPTSESRRKSATQPSRLSDTVSAPFDTVASVTSERGDTFVEIFEALWRRLDLLNSPLGYMIIVVAFTLAALLIIVYALITVTMARRRRRRAREKYEALQITHGGFDEEIGSNTDSRYRQNHENQLYRLPQRFDAWLPAPRRYAGGSASNSRTQTPKNSLSSLKRHAVDHYSTPVGSAGDGAESELERLYRSISPFKRYPTETNVTPSVTSDDSVSLMRRVGATSDMPSGGEGRRRKRHAGGGDRPRRYRQPPRPPSAPSFDHPAPPPPPTVPPPPVPR